jgi:hypothetical protein
MMTKTDLRARFERLLRERKELVDDVDHYNRLHPGNPIPSEMEAIDALILRISQSLHSGNGALPA